MATHHLVPTKQGEFVFKEGDLGTEMFIIHEGSVEILHGATSKTGPTAVLEKGDFFGEMSLLEELPRSASARARTDSKLVRIDGATFDQMLRRNPEIAVRIMRKLSRRLRLAEQGERSQSGTLSTTGELEGSGAAEAGASLRLRHSATGKAFDLSVSQACTVGRYDPVTGLRPEVDLSAVDPDRSSSRRHAKLVARGKQLFVVEDIGTTNGTFVNGERVKAGVPVEVASGDTLRFGLVDLRLEPR